MQVSEYYPPTRTGMRGSLTVAVNRWPHGYAYTYNTLFDPEPWAFTTTSCGYDRLRPFLLE